MSEKELQKADKTSVESSPVERTRSTRVFTPNTDIYEKEDALVLLADMPGVDDKSIDINVERNTLTIEGRIQPEEMEGREPLYSEYVTGDYRRSFTLSNEIDAGRIQASIKDGVLRLVLPKAKEAVPRKIEVQSG